MSSSDKEQFIEDALARRREKHLFRELAAFRPKDKVVISDGERELVNFSGNDYLGLSRRPDVINRAQEYVDEYGAGATASRLINGTFPIHEELENKLASTFGWEAALVFNSGFQANSTIIGTLADRNSLIIADKLSHNSLLQGSLSSRATFRRFNHNSISDLESHLKKAVTEEYSRVFVITESIFSMGGDRSNLEAIAELSQAYDAWLFVDEAHAVGVWGKNGLGLTHEIPGIDLVLGTCGKAFGSFGAFLLCSKRMRKYLVNFCPGFIYTTALPPAVIGSIEASLELIPEIDSERKQIKANIELMRTGVQDIGYSTGDSESQIIPILLGKEQEALGLAEYLEEQGFLAKAIRPPTVPKSSSRIRITLSSKHTKAQINNFVKVLSAWKYG